MKRPSAGTETPPTFAVEIGASWERWAKRRTDQELAEIAIRLKELQESFGHPHTHAGLGLRRLTPRLFEFRISRGIRVIHHPPSITFRSLTSPSDASDSY